MLQGDVDPRLNPPLPVGESGDRPCASRAGFRRVSEHALPSSKGGPLRVRDRLYRFGDEQIEQAERFVKGEGRDAERAALLRSAPILMPFYRRAETEFQKEYVALGVGKDLGLARLSTLVRRLDATAPTHQRLFSDVPPDHWAAKAVGDLRALGLLKGYPDATFHGGKAPE